MIPQIGATAPAPGDEIDLDNTPGKPYTLSGAEGGELLISHDLTIKNKAGGTYVSTIDAAGGCRVFDIPGGVTATLTGLRITGGNGIGAAIVGQGGGIYVNDNATLTLNNDVITNNFAIGTPARGGGIANYGLLTINNSVISGNSATGTATTPEQQGQGEGGGIFTCYLCGGKLFLNSSTVTGNTATGGWSPNLQVGFDGDGGGIFVNGGPTIQGNLAAVITASTIANNSALGGIVPSFVGGNAANGNGGGLYQGSQTGFVTISGSTFSGNKAVGGAGSFAGEGGGNGGAGLGGGVYQDAGAGNITATNSTFGGNTARGGSPDVQPERGGAVAGSGSGGGLYLAGGGTDTLTNDTIARNFATAGGAGGIGQGGGVVTQGGEGSNHAKVLNTLIALNTAAADPDVFGDFVSLGHNLVGNPTGSTGFSAARSDLLNVSAASIGLGQLASNGGPTQTMALSRFSIAVDHGSDSVLGSPYNLTTDQTGRPRKAGAHVDVGAFEFQPPVLVVVVPGRRNGPLF